MSAQRADWNLLQMVSITASETLARALHKGWLAGTALKLQCAARPHNPFDRESEEWLHWIIGFEQASA